MKVRFLLDENLSPRLKTAVLRFNPVLDRKPKASVSEANILRVGDEGAPTLKTQDPDILRYVERAQRLLVTKNRASIPMHVANHLASGGHHCGVFRVRPNPPNPPRGGT